MPQPAGFDIPFHLPDWSTSRHLRPRPAGLLAQHAAGRGHGDRDRDACLALLLGIMRLSRQLAGPQASRSVIVELVRNTPQLMQIIFWYVGVLQACRRRARASTCRAVLFLNVRGLFVPLPIMRQWRAAGVLRPSGARSSLAAVRLAARHSAWPAARCLVAAACLLALCCSLALSTSKAGPAGAAGFNFTGGIC